MGSDAAIGHMWSIFPFAVFLLVTCGAYSHSPCSYSWSHAGHIPICCIPIGHMRGIFLFAVFLLVTCGTYSCLLYFYWSQVGHIPVCCIPFGHMPCMLSVMNGLLAPCMHSLLFTLCCLLWRGGLPPLSSLKYISREGVIACLWPEEYNQVQPLNRNIQQNPLTNRIHSSSYFCYSGLAVVSTLASSA
jgi:hypothetical protein